MPKKRRRFSSVFKAKVALEAVRGGRTINEIAAEYSVHPNQVSKWKSQLLDNMPEVFPGERDTRHRETAMKKERDELYRQIGQLKVEIDRLKKRPPLSSKDKRMMIEPKHAAISIRRQCELLSLNRSTFYKRPGKANKDDILVINAIDEIYVLCPFYGSRRLKQELLRRKNIHVNRKRVQRLMRLMGLEAIYPKPNLSCRNTEHKIYPYLLRNVAVTRPNQVWASDSTYIRTEGGFVYLTVVLDWCSRRVLTWRLSNTLDSSFCVEALEEALRGYGAPTIFNTD